MSGPSLALDMYLLMNPQSHSFWSVLLFVSAFHRWGNRGTSPFECSVSTGLGEADMSGAKAASVRRSVHLSQREGDLPGRNRPWRAIYTDTFAGETVRAEGGGHTSCSFVIATSSATNRKAGEEVGSPDRVWPPPHPSV